MNRIEKLGMEWLKQHGSSSGHDLGVMAANAFQAGYRQALEDAAKICEMNSHEALGLQGSSEFTRAVPAWLINAAIEIRALADQEDTDASGT